MPSAGPTASAAAAAAGEGASAREHALLLFSDPLFAARPMMHVSLTPRHRLIHTHAVAEAAASSSSPSHRPLKRPRSREQEAASLSLPPCDVCKEKARAYCCPRCGVKTCSLACCKAHKAQVKTSTQRNDGHGTIHQQPAYHHLISSLLFSPWPLPSRIRRRAQAGETASRPCRSASSPTRSSAPVRDKRATD